MKAIIAKCWDATPASRPCLSTQLLLHLHMFPSLHFLCVFPFNSLQKRRRRDGKALSHPFFPSILSFFQELFINNMSSTLSYYHSKRKPKTHCFTKRIDVHALIHLVVICLCVFFSPPFSSTNKQEPSDGLTAPVASPGGTKHHRTNNRVFFFPRPRPDSMQ